MSYDNFIPEIWNNSIQTSVTRNCVFAEDCTREYEGSVKKMGDTVHILTSGKPEIYSITRAQAGNPINGPRMYAGEDNILTINQMAYFNFMVPDIDKAQSVEGVMQALTDEASEGMANVMDKYISSFATKTHEVETEEGDTETRKIITNLYESPITLTSSKGSSGYILKVLDDVLLKLYENDVKASTEIVATLSARAWMLFKEAYLDRLSNNNEIMKNGNVAKYSGLTVKMSNNVTASDSVASSGAGDVDNMLVRTKRAMAFVNPHTHSEAYRPEGYFSDALKGYTLFDAKVLRPDEIFNINGKYA